tara:strand:- start:95 stop:508 length:414 start_codon:yes stop_codon:yes gene_type:complete
MALVEWWCRRDLVGVAVEGIGGGGGVVEGRFIWSKLVFIGVDGCSGVLVKMLWLSRLVFGGLEEMGAPLGALGCIRGEVVMDVFLSLLLLLFFAVSCCDYVNCLRRLLLRKQLCSVGGGGALVVVEDKSGETEPPRR